MQKLPSLNFFQILESNFDTSFPIITTKFNKKYHSVNPWMSKSLLISKRTKDKLFHKSMKSPTLTNKENFKSYNTLYRKLCRAAKTRYFSEKF